MSSSPIQPWSAAARSKCKGTLPITPPTSPVRAPAVKVTQSQDVDENARDTHHNSTAARSPINAGRTIGEHRDVEQGVRPIHTSNTLNPRPGGNVEKVISNSLAKGQDPHSTTNSPHSAPHVDESNTTPPSTAHQHSPLPSLVHPLNPSLSENIWPGQDVRDGTNLFARQAFQRPDESRFGGGNIFAALREQGLIAPSDGSALKQHEAVDMLRWEINKESSAKDGKPMENPKHSKPTSDTDKGAKKKKARYMREKAKDANVTKVLRAKRKKAKNEEAVGIKATRAKKKKLNIHEADGAHEVAGQSMLNKRWC